MQKKLSWNMGVPLSINRGVRDDAYWKEMILVLKKIGATRVFLSTFSDTNVPPVSLFEEIAERVKELTPMLKDAGIEPCVWLGHTIGHGGAALDGDCAKGIKFTKIVGCQADGTLVPDTGSFCPMDKKFQRYICEILAALATSKPAMLMLDDDYRLCNHASYQGCFCKLHMARVCKLLGEKITAEELAKGIRTNPVWRKAWRQANGESLYDMAAAMEKAVHNVSPKTRLGLSAVPNMLYRNDGTDIGKLVEIMAGPKCRPYYRTGAAPYWSRVPDETCWLIESTRLQNAMGHAHNPSIEIFAEGDTYPHTTFMTGANNLEAFHEGVLAAGMEGILSYQFSYGDHASTDWNFEKKCEKNVEFHKALRENISSDWIDYGIEPLASPDGFNCLDSTLSLWDDWKTLTPGLRFLPPMGIPLAYGNPKMPVFLGSEMIGAFSDAQLCKALKRGAIIDAPAAEVLIKRNIAIGITNLKRSKVVSQEENCNGVNYMLRSAGDNIQWDYTPETGANIRSVYSDKRPGIAFITLKNGTRIVFLPWNTSLALPWMNHNFGHQELMQEAMEFLTGNPLPVKVSHRAYIRLQIRKQIAKNELAVIIQNTSSDELALNELVVSPGWHVKSVLLPGKANPLAMSQLPNTMLYSLQMAVIFMKKS